VPIADTPASKVNSGFSLIELVVTISIMSILLGIAAASFQTWQQKNNLEAQTREIFTDLNEARTSAFTQKKNYGIVFQPSSYVVKFYDSAAAAADPLNNGTTVKTKNLQFGLTQSGASIVDTHVVFETSGITFDWFTIFVDPSKVSASVNCIVISTARVNMGKINGTACEFK